MNLNIELTTLDLLFFPFLQLSEPLAINLALISSQKLLDVSTFDSIG